MGGVRPAASSTAVLYSLVACSRPQCLRPRGNIPRACEVGIWCDPPSGSEPNRRKDKEVSLATAEAPGDCRGDAPVWGDIRGLRRVFSKSGFFRFVTDHKPIDSLELAIVLPEGFHTCGKRDSPAW